MFSHLFLPEYVIRQPHRTSTKNIFKGNEWFTCKRRGWACKNLRNKFHFDMEKLLGPILPMHAPWRWCEYMAHDYRFTCKRTLASASPSGELCFSQRLTRGALRTFCWGALGGAWLWSAGSGPPLLPFPQAQPRPASLPAAAVVEGPQLISEATAALGEGVCGNSREPAHVCVCVSACVQ